MNYQDITDLQKMCAIISSLFSVASILSGVHHIWRHRSRIGINTNISRRQADVGTFLAVRTFSLALMYPRSL